MPEPVETWSEEVMRLQREIWERQTRLQYLVLGDPRVRVTIPCTGISVPMIIEERVSK